MSSVAMPDTCEQTSSRRKILMLYEHLRLLLSGLQTNISVIEMYFNILRCVFVGSIVKEGEGLNFLLTEMSICSTCGQLAISIQRPSVNNLFHIKKNKEVFRLSW